VAAVTPYRPPALQLPDPAIALRLDANEEPTPPSPAALAAAQAALQGLGRYPDPTAAALRAAIAEHEEVLADQIICGNGSEELILLLNRALLQPGDEVVMPASSFAIFRIAAALAGAKAVRAPERRWGADVDALLSAVTDRTRIVILANPNNPTGALTPFSEIERLRGALPDAVLLILDAAYAEYVTDQTYRPGHELVRPDGNVVVLRTFSKAHGLAGLRVGWGHAPDAVRELWGRVRPVFNISAPAQAAAAASVADRLRLHAVRDAARQASAAYVRLWDELGLESIGGDANFTFVHAPGRRSLVQHLAAKNIRVFGLAGYDLPDATRITFGTPDQNARVMDAVCAWAR
jgi:histidinol-phosphate aminotransferase